MYLLPAIDILDGKAVRLAKGDYKKVTIYHDNPIIQAQEFEEAGASWIHIVDLNGARSGEPENIELIEQILAKTLLKIEVGGGIRNLSTIKRYYEAGVSRVVLGTSLIADAEFAQAAIDEYRALLAAGIDAKKGKVAVAGWEKDSSVNADELARHVAKMGYKHLVYTDINRDGMQSGIDVLAYKNIAKAFGNPVIASGGVAGIYDLYNLGEEAAFIEGVIAGRAIYEKTLDVAQGVEACLKATKKFESAQAAANPCGGALC